MRLPPSGPPVHRLLLALGLLAATSVPALARQAAVPDTGFEACQQWTAIQIEKNHLKLSGAVECRRGDLVLFADEAEIWTDTHQVVLTGNVTFRQRDAQITADRAELNTQTRLGTFHNASGFAVISTKSKKNLLGGQEPDVYFYGDTIEKIGPDRYRITHGGFTTCVQPKPRWQITATSVTLRLDHYALLKNAVMEAKGIPVFYFPAVYYPITKDDRATGFLMPTYGTSTYSGWSLSNAFFWAIDRSQDLTLMDDWYSSRGNGIGAEYRYASAPGSSGFLKFYRLSEHASSIQNTDGSFSSIPGDLSYRVQANVAQALAGHWTVRGSVDYFTSLTVQQAYNTDIYDASNSTRTYSGAISGSLVGFTVNGQYNRTQYLSDASDSTATGGTPRVTLTRNEQPLFGTPLYFSMNSEVREAHARDHVGGDRHRPRPHPLRSAAHPAPAVHEVAVPDGEHLGVLARDLLDAQPLARRQRRRRRRPARAILLSRRVTHHGTGLLPCLEHSRQRFRREVEALGGAVPERAARDLDRRLRPDRAARRHRLHPRRHDAVRLRRDQPLPGQAEARRNLELRRTAERGPVADLLFQPAGEPLRHQLLDELLGPAAKPPLTRPPHGASLADRPNQRERQGGVPISARPGSRAWPPIPRWG